MIRPPPRSTLSLHDALPISRHPRLKPGSRHSLQRSRVAPSARRSEEHTSELQSRFDLVCRLLLEKKKKNITNIIFRHIKNIRLQYYLHPAINTPHHLSYTHH